MEALWKDSVGLKAVQMPQHRTTECVVTVGRDHKNEPPSIQPNVRRSTCDQKPIRSAEEEVRFTALVLSGPSPRAPTLEPGQLSRNPGSSPADTRDHVGFARSVRRHYLYATFGRDRDSKPCPVGAPHYESNGGTPPN